MTLHATAFVLSLETGQVAGMGLLCPDARYASVLWTGATRVDRRFAEPDAWQAVARELSETMPVGPLTRTAACATLLAGAQGGAVTARRLWTVPVEVEAPGLAAGALDALLTSATSKR